MSENSTFSVLCDAYDEHVQNFSVKRLEDRRDVLRLRAIRMQRRSRPASKEDLEKELAALGRKRLNGFVPPANVTRRSQAFKGRADYSHMAWLAIFRQKSSIGPRGCKLMAMARGVEWRHLE